MSDNPYANSFSGTYGADPKASEPAPTLQGFGRAASAAPAADLVKDTTTAKFGEDVVKESRNQPVLVDFWAPWCGPCKQLTPVLERVVKAAGGKVKLVKMNIDEHPSIAGQLGVQSIPAVFAFLDGQPIDGFMGALPESELVKFIDKIVKQAGPSRGGGDPVAEAMAEAAALLEAKDVGSAAQIFGAILQHEPGHPGASAGLAECYLMAGDAEKAAALIDALPEAAASDPAVSAVKARLKLDEEIAGLGNPADLEARLAADPDDHRARFDLALIAQARGERGRAADLLLDLMKRDREFEEDGARRKLLELFEVWGPADPATKDARRKLSSLLFR
ncbi:thioredoxin [Fulvimarina sp. 2208YS6-2-32]|uniref:Thioredoxin n=1 Tax=Fulvimarina uroteuthidis TaxID=3098149 RepID=A0ABU5I2F8_9HYPH|nr:thioredoxin [Fulvimarina sp. 2208YS6-2-32]MDY8109158.1 thioredoxin [Fulvimarina sp. 2208YS6-2-32]